MMGCGLAPQLCSALASKETAYSSGYCSCSRDLLSPKQESLLGLPLGFSAIYPLEEELGPVPGKAPSL